MFKDRHRSTFCFFLASVIVVFFSTRPLQSPWHPFIAGDGLGYYSYLPAKFIYNDVKYNFKWFNRAHDANYAYSTFKNPEDNLLVKYGDKRINKYYQGLSYIWLPFFAGAHLVATMCGYPADGFSAPYQAGIAFASMFYLLLGLIFLRKLILKLSGSELAAVCVPIAIFYGTHLFTYALSANSLSHSYSFTFVTLFLYCVVTLFESSNRARYFFLSFLCLVISVCIRPLNGLVILLVPFFVPPRFFSRSMQKVRITGPDVLIILVALGALYHQLSITHTQTGSFFAYTYTDEKFNFGQPRFFDTLFSYHIGLFVYVPLIMLSLFGIPFLSKAQRIGLPLFFFGIIFLYSCWWYWPITTRAVIDFYAIPAIFLGALISRYAPTRYCAALLLAVTLTVIYFQFKSMQVRRGILHEYSTYREVFWRNFFRFHKASIYPISPSTILNKKEFVQDFETGNFAGNLATGIKHGGAYALLLDSAHYISKIAECPFPSIFNGTGYPKVRFSFWAYFDAGVNALHVFIQFKDKDDRVVFESPFYLNKEDIYPGEWDLKEFGCEANASDGLNAKSVDKIVFTIWNVEGRKNVYIDDAKVELIVADRSFETIR
jgi:hypothetical protein